MRLVDDLIDWGFVALITTAVALMITALVLVIIDWFRGCHV